MFAPHEAAWLLPSVVTPATLLQPTAAPESALHFPQLAESVSSHHLRDIRTNLIVPPPKYASLSLETQLPQRSVFHLEDSSSKFPSLSLYSLNPWGYIHFLE